MVRQVSFEQLMHQFQAWAGSEFKPQAGEWLAVDGKSIKGTVQAGWESFQNFVSVVSVYSHQQRIVLAQQRHQNKIQSEIQVLEQLLEQLGLSEVIVTLDALHAQKNGSTAG